MLGTMWTQEGMEGRGELMGLVSGWQLKRNLSSLEGLGGTGELGEVSSCERKGQGEGWRRKAGAAGSCFFYPERKEKTFWGMRHRDRSVTEPSTVPGNSDLEGKME